MARGAGGTAGAVLLERWGFDAYVTDPASGRANGAMFAGSRLGAAIGFPVVTWMLTRRPWRLSFQILGGAGLAWALFWILWFRNYPPKRVEAPQTALPTDLGFGEVLRSRVMLLGAVQFIACNFTFFISLSWMLPYLKSHYGLSDARAAAYAMAPPLAGASAQWVAGCIVDWIYRSPLRSWSRRIPAMLGLSLAAAGVLGLTQAGSPEAAVVCFTIAAFGVDMTVGPSFVVCADIAGKNTGSVSAALNMIGNLGAFVSGLAFPYLHKLTGSANTYFAVAALLNAVGVICWLGMRSVQADAKPLQPAAVVSGGPDLKR